VIKDRIAKLHRKVSGLHLQWQ